MRRPIGIFLAAWSFGFACVHMAWATGWRMWLDDDMPSIFERPWFLAYDIVSGLLMFAAAWVAWRLATGPTVRWMRTATLVGSTLALLRGVPIIISDVITSEYAGISFFADVWFTVSGLAGLALWAMARPVSNLAR